MELTARHVSAFLLSAFVNAGVLLLLGTSLLRGAPSPAPQKTTEAFRLFDADSFRSAAQGQDTAKVQPRRKPQESLPAVAAETMPFPAGLSEAPAEAPPSSTDTAFSGDPAAGNSMAGGAAGISDNDGLLQLIRSLIDKRLRYPAAARRRGIEGTVKLTLGIGSGGVLEGLQLRESSGSALLDDAALRLARDIFPLSGLSLASATELTVSIRYDLN